MEVKCAPLPKPDPRMNFDLGQLIQIQAPIQYVQYIYQVLRKQAKPLYCRAGVTYYGNLFLIRFYITINTCSHIQSIKLTYGIQPFIIEFYKHTKLLI